MNALFKILAMLFLFFLSLFSKGGSSEYQGNIAIKDTADAVSVAAHYCGFDKYETIDTKKIQENSRLITIMGDNTPFLHNQINNCSVWIVKFDSIDLSKALKSKSPNNSSHRTFDVFLDQETGKLLKIHYREPGYDSCISPLPVAGIAEEQMNRTGEKYLGFPDSMPLFSFIEALDNVSHNPAFAREIIALYVLDSHLVYGSRSAWVIDLRGINPIPISGRNAEIHVPEYQRNHYRTVIDATTRHRIFTDTFPQGKLESRSKTNQPSEKNK